MSEKNWSSTSEGLAKEMRDVLTALKMEMRVEIEKDHPEGADLPCVKADGFTVWLSESGDWIADAFVSSPGSYYEPPSGDVMEIYKGKSPQSAIEKVITSSFQEQMACFWESRALEAEANEAEMS